MENKLVKISELRQVKGVGAKTIERIKEQFDRSEYVSEYDPSIHIEPNEIVLGDMLEVMNGIPDKSVDMILTDLPYGTTACNWDTIIPFDKLWEHYNRIVKGNGAIVLFGSEPFSSQMRISNIDNYKYDWIWEKQQGANFANVNYQPFRVSENISIFGDFATSYNTKVPKNYNPQFTEGNPYTTTSGRQVHDTLRKGSAKDGGYKTVNKGSRHPRNIIRYSHDREKHHPTQKPVALLEYLINTYTKKGDIVLDSAMGSGSTCVAAKKINRRYIGIELNEEYFKIAKNRIDNTKMEEN